MDFSKLKRLGGNSKTSDTTRLALLTVLALIVVAFIIFFNYTAEKQRDEMRIDPEDYVDAPDIVRIPGAEINRDKLAMVSEAELENRVVREPEPYLHLMEQASCLVYGDMELLGIKAAHPEEIQSDPSAFRGAPLEIKGELQWYEEVTGQNFQHYRGYLTSQEGDYFYFTVLQIPSDMAIGDVVKLQGFFFKLFSFTLPEEDVRADNVVYLVGKQLIPSFYRISPVGALDMTLLNSLYDYDIQDMIKPFQEKALYHMLSFVQNMTDETYQSFAFEEVLPAEIRRSSGKYRGCPVKVLGEVVWLQERNLGPDGENPIGPKTIFHGLMFNSLGRFCYFLSLEKPVWLEDPDWKNKKDLVYTKGFFFRNYAYPTRRGSVQPAPVIISRGFEKFILPEDNTIQYISIFILGGASIFILFFFVHVFRDSKQNQAYREKFIKRKKKQLARMMNPPPGEGTTEDPPATPE